MTEKQTEPEAAPHATGPAIERPAPFVDAHFDDGRIPEEHLESMGQFDLVVGINAKDVGTTIVHVLNVVCSGIQQHFPSMRALVVVCDGASQDETVALARFYPTPNGIHKLVMQQAFGPGKGNGVRTILEIARRVDAQACACVDGDLVSIQPTWIENLLRPVLYGLTDMVVPYYLRDKWDGVITNHLCYPLTAALYGTSVRQPIGGDYSFSRKLIDRLLNEGVPAHFGIDIHLATVAIAENFRIQEAPLGIKVHASTTGYTDPKKVLSGMYLEVVGTLLDLAAKYEAAWRDPDASHPVLLTENVVPYYDRLPPQTKINEDGLRSLYREGVAERQEVLRQALSASTFARLMEDCRDGIPMDTWARIVYEVAAYHIDLVRRVGPDERPDEHLHALGALGLGRFLHFVQETQEDSLQEAYDKVRQQAKLFSRLRPDLAQAVDARRGPAPPQQPAAPARQPRGS